MADDAVMFLCRARQEARHVFERHQGDVEAVAETDEAVMNVIAYPRLFETVRFPMRDKSETLSLLHLPLFVTLQR